MPYIKRSDDGAVIALLRQPQAGCSEYLPANNSEVLQFIESAGLEGDVHLALQDSDGDIARVTEDLIYLLVKKNAILFTELPDVVQTKLIAREKLRSHLGGVDQSPISDDDTI